MIGPFLTDTITRIRVTVNDYGQETGRDEKSIAARAERTTKIIRRPEGQEKQASFVIMAGANADIEEGDRIQFSGSSTSWEVLEVYKARGFADSHLEVTV